LEGLHDEDIQALNKVLEKMTVPAQKSLVKYLEELSPSKRKGHLKKFINNRKKLESERSKILVKIEKLLKDKKGIEKAFEIIPKALELSDQLADSDSALEIAKIGQKILAKMNDNPELKSVVSKHRTKMLKEADDLNQKAQDTIFKGEFFEAGVIYRKCARLALMANAEDKYENYINLAVDCDSQGTV